MVVRIGVYCSFNYLLGMFIFGELSFIFFFGIIQVIKELFFCLLYITQFLQLINSLGCRRYMNVDRQFDFFFFEVVIEGLRGSSFVGDIVIDDVFFFRLICGSKRM